MKTAALLGLGILALSESFHGEHMKRPEHLDDFIRDLAETDGAEINQHYAWIKVLEDRAASAIFIFDTLPRLALILRGEDICNDETS
jgi:hypothetical protein